MNLTFMKINNNRNGKMMHNHLFVAIFAWYQLIKMSTLDLSILMRRIENISALGCRAFVFQAFDCQVSVAAKTVVGVFKRKAKVNYLNHAVSHFVKMVAGNTSLIINKTM